MVGLVWFVLGLGCLYLWLSGHWFGRALGFIALTSAGCFVVGVAPVFVGYRELGYLGTAGIMWFVAALPMLFWRQKLTN